VSGRRAERGVESLLEQASPRPEPPADVRARVLAAVEREWRLHKRRRWTLPAALAAAVLAAVTAVLMIGGAAPTELRITQTTGVWVEGVHHLQGGAEISLGHGADLEAEGPTRLVMARDVEIRLRGGTRLTWRGPGAVTLERGSIYVDTRGESSLQVHTTLGVVTDVGTRFMVTLRDGGMEVALREGSAAIDTERGTYMARAGDRAGDVVVVSRERIVTQPEPASASRWQWIHEVHPGYARREILPLLGDIADDLGLGLEFESPAVQAAALQGTLEGDLSGLDPEQALEVVLATSGFVSRRPSAGRLLIGFQSLTD
jgi:ferric-dicitrate binding protein FerR (iron transport regulator)